MDVIGWIATVVIAGVIVAGVVIGVRSIPDVKRYVKMRHM
jgi:hypothetical protein